MKRRGFTFDDPIKSLIFGLVIVMVTVIVMLLMTQLGETTGLQRCISYLEGRGYWVLAAGGCVDGDLNPCSDNTSDLGSATFRWRDLHLGGSSINLGDVSLTNPTSTLTIDKPLELTGDAVVWVEYRPDLDFESVRAHGVPTWVQQGVFGGFSLPIWAANDEELQFDICVPNKWDGISDISLHIDCWVGLAQDAANDAFTLQLQWECITPNVDIIPATSNTVISETTTGICAQFQSFQVYFTIDYDIDVGDAIIADDILGFRLRRVAVVAGNEIDGEVVINHSGVEFRRDKLGVSAP